MKAINRGFFLSAIISAAAVFVISAIYMDDLRPAVAVAFGLILASIIQVLTQYFTDTKFRPVQEIAEATQTGPATTILSGFAVGLESTVWSILIIAGTIAGAFLLGNRPREALYFISLTGMGMLTTVGVIVSMDTYGPIADNAQGIAEMSGEFEGRPAEILGRPRRGRELDEGDHEGDGDRDRRDRRDLAVRLLRGGARRGGLRIRGHPDRPARRARRPADRRLGRVPVLLARDPSRRTRRLAGGGRGPQAVPRPPRDHDLRREAGLRARRRHLHEDLAPRADDAGAARRAEPGHRRVLVRAPRRSARSSRARSSRASCSR